LTHGEHHPNFLCLLLAAVIVGGLTHGMLLGTLKRQMDVPEKVATLPKFTLTGRDENGRQTLDYGENQ